MLVSFFGSRGTVPTSGQGTICFSVDNKFLFDINPEFVQSMMKLTDRWDTSRFPDLDHLQSLYGRPGFTHIEHVFISHLHLDHWGGLRHFLTRVVMFEYDVRVAKQPLHVYIPKHATKVLEERTKIRGRRDSESTTDSGAFMADLLGVDIGGDLEKYVQFHEIDPAAPPLHIGPYSIEARFNRHMVGSLGYKIYHTRWRLNDEARNSLGIPQGMLLGRLQKRGEIEFRGRTIRREEVFQKDQFALGYSGDTPFDPSLVRWFADVQALVHETTYLDHDPSHHSDVHTVFTDLMPEVSKLSALQVFLPAHISQRYTWEEVEALIGQVQSHQTNTGSLLKIYPPKAWDVLHLTPGEAQIISLTGTDKW